MKKQITFLRFLTVIVIFFGMTINTVAQESSFTVDASSDFSSIDLTNASQTYVGTITPTFGGMDFGPDNVLYGIDYNTNELYSVDTSDASTTLIGTMTPPANHIWTGFAYDNTTGILFANSSWGIAAGESSLHEVDVTDASTTLVGTQSTVTAFGCIAADDNGQLYGLRLSASPKIYLIDKTDASVTLLGDTGEFGGAGMGYGMDYDSETQTMFLTAYDSFTFNNDLYTIDLTDGSADQVGSLSMWTFALAIVSPFACDFTADVTEICTGTTVNFTNMSSGADTYSWTFEGGTPATSTDENPSVVYNTAGEFNVELEITNTLGDTEYELKVDYINVLETPAKADTPDGEEDVCTGLFYSYSIDEIPYAENYEWELSPSDAGILTPNDNEAELDVDIDWTGDFTIIVRATNMCGDGEWSDELEGTVFLSPEEFSLEGGGSYCLGDDGVEITQDGSQSGISYELYLSGDATGIIVEGTGSEISFGLVEEEGYYVSIASNDNCEYTMQNQVQVSVAYPPLEPGTPTGPDVVCADTTTTYESDGTDDADSYEWQLSPVDAGTITGNGLEASVEWNTDFSGTALVSLYGINDCGDGNDSEALEVEVNGLPTPEVDGESLVCDNHTEDYSVEENDGSTYTWTVTGGTIIAGEGTYTITVEWGEPGNGTVYVEEISDAGCEGSSETFDVVIDDCTDIDENIAENDISIYPNPAKNHLNIKINAAVNTQGTAMIFDLAGKQLMKQEIENGNQNIQFNIAELKGGLYLIKIHYENGFDVTKRFIKE